MRLLVPKSNLVLLNIPSPVHEIPSDEFVGLLFNVILTELHRLVL